MSYEIFIQRFEHGDVAPMPTVAFRTILIPLVDRTEPEFEFWHVRTVDGGEADLYAAVTGPAVDRVMVSRFSGGLVLDVVVELARANGAILLVPGCPALLLHEDQRPDLPEELRAEAVLIANGADVAAALAEY